VRQVLVGDLSQTHLRDRQSALFDQQQQQFEGAVKGFEMQF